MRICDAAVEVLRETDNPAVMFEDCCLIDLIAKRAERIIEGELPNSRHIRIINALDRQPGILIPGKSCLRNGNRDYWVRSFKLPEGENA